MTNLPRPQHQTASRMSNSGLPPISLSISIQPETETPGCTAVFQHAHWLVFSTPTVSLNLTHLTYTSKDADGDSEMASSPESGINASEPSPAGSRTPTNNPQAQAQLAGPSELSPPGSQPQTSNVPGGGVGGTAGSNGSLAAAEANRPGATWMNKRAQEEYDWAMGHVVDKDFSLSALRSLPDLSISLVDC